MFKRSDEQNDGELELEEGENWDWEVPGSGLSSLSQNTELGTAVNNACDEAGHLSSMQAVVLQQADAVLKKAGWKHSLFDAPPPSAEDAGRESDDAQ